MTAEPSYRDDEHRGPDGRFPPAWVAEDDPRPADERPPTLTELAEAIVRSDHRIEHKEVPDLRALIEAVQRTPGARLAKLDTAGKPTGVVILERDVDNDSLVERPAQDNEQPTQIVILGGEITSCACAGLDVRCRLITPTCFSGQASFNNAHFHADTRFPQAEFDCTVSFDESRFQSRALFIGAQFRAGTSFLATHFDGEALFDRAHFHSDAIFQYTHFHAAVSFEKAHFHTLASFFVAHFHKTAQFDMAEFQSVGGFELARFQDSASFRYAHFHGEGLL